MFGYVAITSNCINSYVKYRDNFYFAICRSMPMMVYRSMCARIALQTFEPRSSIDKSASEVMLNCAKCSNKSLRWRKKYTTKRRSLLMTQKWNPLTTIALKNLIRNSCLKLIWKLKMSNRGRTLRMQHFKWISNRILDIRLKERPLIVIAE